MQPKQPTEDLRIALDVAQQETAQRHGNFVDVEHLLLGIAKSTSGPAHDLLSLYGVKPASLYDAAAESVGMPRPTTAPVKGLSKWAKSALDRATTEATGLNHNTVNSGHLLLSLMGETDGAVHEILGELPFTPDEGRAFLRQVGDLPAARQPNVVPMPAGAATAAARPTGASGQPVVVPFRTEKPRRKPGQRQPVRSSNWPLILGALAVFIAYLVAVLPGNTLFTFAIVLIGWVFSLTLHEFSHALVAYLGGDYTVKQKGYLSFNPLKYTHPMLSIGMPLLFLAMGGIGLPGGAVYIERHRLKNKWWGAAVSAAGPAANMLFTAALVLPFALGLVDTQVIEMELRFGIAPRDPTFWQNTPLWSAVAFLAMLQVTAVIFNLLPIPPLDGFGIIEPFLDQQTRFQLRQLGTYGLMLIFIALWFIQPVNEAFWNTVFDVCRDLQLSPRMIIEGLNNFTFWR